MALPDFPKLISSSSPTHRHGLLLDRSYPDRDGSILSLNHEEVDFEAALAEAEAEAAAAEAAAEAAARAAAAAAAAAREKRAKARLAAAEAANSKALQIAANSKSPAMSAAPTPTLPPAPAAPATPPQPPAPAAPATPPPRAATSDAPQAPVRVPALPGGWVMEAQRVSVCRLEELAEAHDATQCGSEEWVAAKHAPLFAQDSALMFGHYDAKLRCDGLVAEIQLTPTPDRSSSRRSTSTSSPASPSSPPPTPGWADDVDDDWAATSASPLGGEWSRVLRVSVSWRRYELVLLTQRDASGCELALTRPRRVRLRVLSRAELWDWVQRFPPTLVDPAACAALAKTEPDASKAQRLRLAAAYVSSRPPALDSVRPCFA